MPCNNHKILVWGEISKKKKKQYKETKNQMQQFYILQVDVLLTNMDIYQSWIQTFKYSLSGIFHSFFLNCYMGSIFAHVVYSHYNYNYMYF